MWKHLIAFQVAARLLSYQVTPLVLLAYLEFLVHCEMSESNISNHVTAIRALHIMHGLPTMPLFLKSLKINKTFQPKISPVITINTLMDIVKACMVYQVLYLLMFFSFLRLSKVLPHSTKQYDHTRHISRGDIIFSEHGAILLKWSKTIQDTRETQTIAIPSVGQYNICPIVSLNLLLHTYAGSDNNALFVIYRKH